MVNIIIKTTEKQKEAILAKSTHVLVKGIPGSGKTIVLIEKVKDILENEPNSKILFITFNHTLRAYIDSQFEGSHVSERLTLSTYHAWAKEALTTVLGNIGSNNFKRIETIFKRHYLKYPSKSNYFKDPVYESFVKEEWEWVKGKAINSLEEYLEVPRTGRGGSLNPVARQELYAFFEQIEAEILLKNLVPHVNYGKLIMLHADKVRDEYGYTHILVDEAQDLTQAEMTSLSRLVNNNGQLVVAADLGQKIYKTDYTWKSAEINIMGGRTKTLDISHRSTKQIMNLATSLLEYDPLIKMEDSERPQNVIREGIMPYILTTSNEQECINNLIIQLRTATPNSNIGILTFSNYEGKKVIAELAKAKIYAKKVDKDSPHIEQSGINVLTMYGAKGLEFDIVIIPNLNERFPYLKNVLQEDKEEQVNIMRRLLYVSMTRARNELYLIYSGNPSRYIAEMNKQFYISQEL